MIFLSNENINLIWKVVSQTNKISREQLIISMNDYNRINNINSSLTKDQLINVNKSYISTLKKNLSINPVSVNPVSVENIIITQPYTFEDIQNKKREQFNEELSKKQKEFSSFNQISVPPPLKFNEDIDKPISEMEELIAKTIAERTLDIENIHKKIEPVKIKIDKSNISLDKKHISWKEELPLDDFSLKEKINQIDKKLNLIIELLNTNKN